MRMSIFLGNRIFCEIIHRMGSLYGNGSLAAHANLAYVEFIHPRMLEENEDMQNKQTH